MTNPNSPWGTRTVLDLVDELSDPEDRRFDRQIVDAFLEDFLEEEEEEDTVSAADDPSSDGTDAAPDDTAPESDANQQTEGMGDTDGPPTIEGDTPPVAGEVPPAEADQGQGADDDEAKQHGAKSGAAAEKRRRMCPSPR